MNCSGVNPPTNSDGLLTTEKTTLERGFLYALIAGSCLSYIVFFVIFMARGFCNFVDSPCIKTSLLSRALAWWVASVWILLSLYFYISSKVSRTKDFIDWEVTVCWIGIKTICDHRTDEYCDFPFQVQTILSSESYDDGKEEYWKVRTCVDINCDTSDNPNETKVQKLLTTYQTGQSYTGRLNPATGLLYLTTFYDEHQIYWSLLVLGFGFISFIWGFIMHKFGYGLDEVVKRVDRERKLSQSLSAYD